MIGAGMSLAELGDLPTVIDLVTAGKALGLGRTTSYQLARTGEFPCRVIRIGRRYRVPTPDLLSLLGYTKPTEQPNRHIPVDESE